MKIREKYEEIVIKLIEKKVRAAVLKMKAQVRFFMVYQAKEMK